MLASCLDCGETRHLNQDGVCEWRAGCEHRALRQHAAERRLELEIEFIYAEMTVHPSEVARYHDLGWCHDDPHPQRPDIER